jgi:hypothetical protein
MARRQRSAQLVTLQLSSCEVSAMGPGLSLLAALTLATAAGAPETALIEAARAGDLPEVKRLLDQGAQAGEPDASGESALCVAAEAGRLDVLQALTAKPASFINCKRGEVLDYAARSGVAAIVRVVATEQQVALYPYRVHSVAEQTARDGNEGALLALLAAGADINALDREIGATALHRLARAGHDSGVDLLLKNGADPSLAIKTVTPAEAARRAGHDTLATKLDAAAVAWRAALATAAPDAYLDAPRFRTIATLDAYALAIVRNEIFARHGQKFQRYTFNKAFELMPWYKPRGAPVAEAALTVKERQVLGQIRDREKTLGGPLRFE